MPPPQLPPSPLHARARAHTHTLTRAWQESTQLDQELALVLHAATAAQEQVLAKSSALYDPPHAEVRHRLKGAWGHLRADLGLAADVFAAGQTAL